MMKRLASLLVVVFVGSFLVPAADEAPWIWAGLEILGNHKVPRAEIEKMITIPIGGEYHRGDAPFWTESCAEVQKKFDFAAVKCGDRPLRVFDGRKAYLIVDIVERGHEDLLKFGEAPSGSVPFANDEMVRISGELSAKTMAGAMAGQYYNESAKQGYLTYTDPTGKNEDLTPQVQRLAQLVPQHRDNVLAVLRGESDPKKRQEAATLLNWAGGDPAKTLGQSLPFLNDPDEGVRNNVSRYMIQFVGEVKSKKVRHQLIDAFVDQLARPSHGDRNKGIYNLLGIANAWPSDRGYIRAHGGESIRYLAENSILFNVKPPAQELLALVDQNDPRGALRRYRYDPKIEEECLRAITLQGLLVGLLPLVCTAPALAFSSGITGRSGNPATNGGLFCNSCHAGGAAPEVTLTGPSLVATGSTHDLVLAIRGGQEVAGGLDVSATGGTLFPIDPGTRLQNGEITHLSPRNVDAQGTVSFTVRWTAPSTPGTVTLYAAGNSVNRNFGPSGDLAATTTQVINVADTVPAPGEAAGATLTPLLVTGRDAGTGLLSLSYGVACAATGHRLYVAALAGPPAWSAAVCEIGATGSYAGFDPGSGSIAFIVVAHDGSRDGSYGLDRGSGGIETERAPAPASLCSAVQDLAQRCDAAP